MVDSVRAESSSASQVEIKVPATSANMGPGFDCLGCALELHNTLVLERLPGLPVVQPDDVMVAGAAANFFKHPEVRLDTFGFRWSIDGRIPVSRGLGSSVTVRLGVLAGLNALAGEPLDRDQLLALCSEAEGHPDNAGPGVFGGFFVGAGQRWFRFPISDELRFVLLIPRDEVLTDPSRGALPVAVPHADAVMNTANACGIVAAFASGQYKRLRGVFEDYLHQAYRAHLMPGLMEVIEAGTAAGALGGWLSGSGSTIACLSADEDSAGAVANAMSETHSAVVGGGGRAAVSKILAPDNDGVQWSPITSFARA